MLVSNTGGWSIAATFSRLVAMALYASKSPPSMRAVSADVAAECAIRTALSGTIISRDKVFKMEGITQAARSRGLASDAARAASERRETDAGGWKKLGATPCRVRVLPFARALRAGADMEVVPATRKPREKSREKKTPVRSKRETKGRPRFRNRQTRSRCSGTARDGASRVPIGSENILTGSICGCVHAFGEGDTRARATTERVYIAPPIIYES